MFESRTSVFKMALVVLATVGVVGLKLVEPTATWHDAFLWTITAFSTFGLDLFQPTNLVSKYFQSTYLVLSFLATGLALTIIIPPIYSWWEAPKKGGITIRRRRRKPLYLLVNPVDWEKVESVWVEMSSRIQLFELVVVSETLEEISPHLLQSGIHFVHGCLRRRETYLRAGLDWATGVFVCAGSYNDIKADEKTAGIVTLIEQYQSGVRSVVEVVSANNFDLFTGDHTADATVAFDPTTLQGVAQWLYHQLGSCPAQITINTIDEAQAVEWTKQLKSVGVLEAADGIAIHVILPTNLDDPSASDFEVNTTLKRSTAKLTVGLYLSVLSTDLFVGVENVLCADRIMAKALVSAMNTSKTSGL